jgi:tetratricopeptide (TPR) repeat protein
MLPALVLAAAVLSASAHAQSPALGAANAALQAGEADKALALLNPLVQPGGGQAEAFNLRCRVQLTLQHWDRAASDCEQAVKLDGQNSGYHLWLGRALGERAGRASFLSAYSLAKRVRDEFEEAVRLDQRNAEAMADLGQFYYSAPGVVGGGVDKAQRIAGQLEKVDAGRGHELRAAIAEQAKDLSTAEREFKLAVSSGAHPAFQWMTLANFYRRRERWTEMDSSLHSGETAALRDKHAAVALYLGASTLNKAGRDPALAAKLLEEYLASSAKTEEAPAFAAHVLLARVRTQLGDPAAADRERVAALALAHDYKPAQDKDMKH